MNDARNPSKDTETDVDEEVGVASPLEEDGERRQEEGEEVDEDVAVGGDFLDHCDELFGQ